MRGGQIAAALAAGASAAQLGTAFLATPESGANAVHKQALTNPLFVRTELTRAFSGRPARGLVNRFLREHGPYAPAAYPEIHHLTSPLRKAAAKAGDAQGMALWAGQGHRMARELPAGQLVEVLAAELAAARTALSAGRPAMTAPVFVVEHFDAGGGGRVRPRRPRRPARRLREAAAGRRGRRPHRRGRALGRRRDVLAAEGKDRLVVQLDVGVRGAPGAPRITVVQALPKGDRGELAVETMTETGVDAIVPWAASRCITQWKGDRGLKALGKWRATAREAGKQSRRVRFPEVADAATDQAGCRTSRQSRLRRRPARERRGDRSPPPNSPPRARSCWSSAPKAASPPRSWRCSRRRARKAYRLGPTVLRTSTAGTAAAALLLGRTGRWS